MTMNRRLRGGARRHTQLVPLLPYAAISMGVLVLVWVGIRNLNSETGALTLLALAAILGLTIRQAAVVGEGHRMRARSKERDRWDRFTRLLQQGSDLVLLVDATWAIRFATPSAERVLGVAPEMLIGRQVESFADVNLVHGCLAAAMVRPPDSPGEPLEIPIQLPDGTARTIELVATMTMDEANEPMFVVNIRNVTERHTAAEAMRRSEAHERAMLEAIPDQILRFDRSGRFLGGSGAPSPGAPFSDAALGKTFAEVLPAALARLCQEALDRAFEEGGIHEISYSNDRPDGLHFFDTRVVSVGEQEGLAIVRDVTKTREGTVALQRMAHILDATPDIVCSFSTNGRISYANAAFRKLFGLPVDEVLESADALLTRFPEVRQIFREMAIPEAVKNGYWRGDLEFRGDGIDTPISMIVVSHESPGKAPDYFSVIGRDISQGRQTENDLTEAKEAADAASKAKGAFLATMSHEIRTPMNGIIGAVELLLDTQLTAEQMDFASTLRDSSEALLDIINDVLDFSKIEANSLELERLRFDLGATIDSVCRVLGGAAARKGLQLLVSIDDDVPTSMEGDPGRLRQVLTNLVGNAVKFTEHGEVLVHVMRSGIQTEGRIGLHFEVRDTGIGIAPDVQARLFQSFAQADGSMSRRFGGTGLGLAISRRLVGLMGGELGVHSRLGDGSTFWFTAVFEADPTARRATQERPLGDFRILLLDDKPTSRGILLGQLAGWGMRAFAEATESDARRALQIARDSSDPFTCLFIDGPVAGLSGEAMASRFDPMANLANTHVVVLGAGGSTQEHTGQLSRAVHLAKPVGASALLDCLIHLLAPMDPGVADEPDAGHHRLVVRAPRTDSKVLLVEDNEVNRRVACAILGRLGYRPDTAIDGFEAVRAASKTLYDVILMDCQMPGMDGFEATGKIRALDTGGVRVPIVALTANATASDRDRCLAAGMDDYLAKPVRLEAMQTVMVRWLGEDTPGTAPATGPGAAADVLPVLVSDAVSRATASAAESSGASEQPLMDATPILNREAMAAIRDLNTDDGEDILASLVDLFLEQADGQLTAIQAAIREADATVLGSIAHTMKGASRSVGAVLIGDLAEKLEQRGKAGSAAEPQLATQLAAALLETRSAFLAERSDYERRRSNSPGGPSSPGVDRVGEAA